MAIIVSAAILATLRAGFEFGIQLLKFLQSSNGKRMVAKALDEAEKNEQSWNAFWRRVGEITARLFSSNPLEIKKLRKLQ